MISTHRSTDSSRLHGMKRDWLRSLVAPMDGMWESGLIPRAPHWEVHMDEDVAGFCVVTDEGVLLQFYLHPEVQSRAVEVLDHLQSERGVMRAVASTVDPWFLGLALDRQESVAVHTWMFTMRGAVSESPPEAAEPSLTPLDPASLDTVVDMQIECLGGNESLRDWLIDYSGRLIGRGELLVLEQGEFWLGLGEFRRSASQPDVVDIGMMVSPEYRGRGLATEILRRLARWGLEEGLRPICSTTVDNVASRKAIVRAGFSADHRIVDIWFR